MTRHEAAEIIRLGRGEGYRECCILFYTFVYTPVASFASWARGTPWAPARGLRKGVTLLSTRWLDLWQVRFYTHGTWADHAEGGVLCPCHRVLYVLSRDGARERREKRARKRVNQSSVAHQFNVRFRRASLGYPRNVYPRIVAFAYGLDHARALRDTDEQVDSTVWAWQLAQDRPRPWERSNDDDPAPQATADTTGA